MHARGQSSPIDSQVPPATFYSDGISIGGGTSISIDIPTRSIGVVDLLLHERLMFRIYIYIHVGKYIIPMDPMGYGKNNKNKVYLLHMFRQTIHEASQASF